MQQKFLHFLHQTSGCYFIGRSEKKNIYQHMLGYHLGTSPQVL